MQELNTAPSPSLSLSSGVGSVYHLQVSQVLWGCVCRCWAERIYLPPLAHRFWKLTLQLLSRYAKCVTEVRPNGTGDNTHTTTLTNVDVATNVTASY